MPRYVSCLLTSFVAFGVTASAADLEWPTFRGPQRSGVSDDTGLLDRWPEGGPTLLWEADGMGRGYASPAIADGKIYILGDGLSTAEDRDEYLICLNQSDGSLVWQFKTGKPWNSGPESWQSSRSTATVDDDRVYTLTAFGQLYCVDTESGKEVWKIHLENDLGGKKADSWGYSESVTIDGNLLICTPGGGKNTMVALNKMTGETVWSCSSPEDRGAGHASVVISEVFGKKVYVQITGSSLMGVLASDGTLLWTYDIPRTTAVIPTPIVKDDLVFISVGYNTGGALIRQVATASGGVDVEEVYGLKPALNNKHGGVVLVGDYVFGDSGDRGKPFCAELGTGEIVWSERGSGKKSASVTAADGKVFFRYSNGVMTMVPASPDQFKETGSFKVPGSGSRPSWAHPVILGGKLYLREGDKLLCYDLKN
ncbi:MAG: PQQ-binding-like beta-propeller repeat protein [Planctomycetota bacterium]